MRAVVIAVALTACGGRSELDGAASIDAGAITIPDVATTPDVADEPAPPAPSIPYVIAGAFDFPMPIPVWHSKDGQTTQLGASETHPAFTLDGKFLTTLHFDAQDLYALHPLYIAVIDVASGQVVRQQALPADITYPAGFSPRSDAQRLVIWTPNGTRMEVLDADGSSHALPGRVVSTPRYGPDDTTIAFESDDGVYAVRDDGTNEHLVAAKPTNQLLAPGIGVGDDGASAVVGMGPSSWWNGNGGVSIALISLIDGTLQTVTPSDEVRMYFQFTPDSSGVVFLGPDGVRLFSRATKNEELLVQHLGRDLTVAVDVQ